MTMQNTTHVYKKGCEGQHVFSRACLCQPYKDRRLTEGPVVVHREEGVEMPLDWGTMAYAFLDGLRNTVHSPSNQ